MQAKWGLRLFIRDLIILVVAFLISHHFYVQLINDPYVQKIFFQ